MRFFVESTHSRKRLMRGWPIDCGRKSRNARADVTYPYFIILADACFSYDTPCYLPFDPKSSKGSARFPNMVQALWNVVDEGGIRTPDLFISERGKI
jgi:hypothetical protein